MRLVDEGDGVDDEGQDALGVLLVRLDLRLHVVLEVVEARGGVRGERAQLRGELLRVAQVAQAHAVARSLARGLALPGVYRLSLPDKKMFLKKSCYFVRFLLMLSYFLLF